MAASTSRPIIGILSLPTENAPPARSYIAASYVKYLEAAGARVVPIPYTEPSESIASVFASLNGILFTGGGADLNGTYFEAEKQLVQLVILANNFGEHVPLWGTCLGFEAIVNIIASSDVLKDCVAENVTMALEPTALAAASRMFSSLPREDYNSLVSRPITMNNHQHCVPPSAFQDNPLLGGFFNVLSTNKDLAGAPFVSSIEGKKYPIYATQWHPEKNAFEWMNPSAIDHSPAAISAMNAMARFFVGEARLNGRSFPSAQAENAALIYNYAPAFTGKRSPVADFQQTYYFQ